MGVKKKLANVIPDCVGNIHEWKNEKHCHDLG